MKTKYKKIIKAIVGKDIIAKKRYIGNNRRKYYSKDNKIIGFTKSFFKTKVYQDSSNKGNEIKMLLSNVKLGSINPQIGYYYYIDVFKCNLSNNRVIDNLSIDYSRVLDHSINDFREMLKNCDKNFKEIEEAFLDGAECLINRINDRLKETLDNDNVGDSLSGIINRKASSLKDALQRILFWNMLVWQTGHTLNGLGRLDLILGQYYEKDIKNNISKEVLRDNLKNFIIVLHDFYELKSRSLKGDTGQIIELGGKNPGGTYFYNNLTYLFIDIMEEVRLPDPKLLLRVSKLMPRDLFEQSLRCIKTGIGCPLFANDDIIVEKLVKFGYDEVDAYNYGTSACWEPNIIGKSSSQNNVSDIVFMIPFNRMLDNEELSTINNREKLVEKFKVYLKGYIKELVSKVNKMRYEKDPILSLFIDDCISQGKDISEGGAKYNDIGILSVGLSNLINSIFNIDELVFIQKEFAFDELNEIRKNNFEGNEQLLKRLKNVKKYGTDNEEVITLVNDLMNFVSTCLMEEKTFLGGRFKIGLSSPNYISNSQNIEASFDGRKNTEPFAVHISSDLANGYTELIQFASSLDYGENRFNGNVVDFIVSTNFIEDNFEKFVDFLVLSTDVGFFEMQINVLDSKTLIEARNNPEKFPNLVVRVWGFSAYFKDLPDNYKDYIIERALKSEGAYN